MNMKNTIRFSVVLMFLFFAVSCAGTKDKNTITGKVVAVEFGKDGYTAKINTDKNEIYLALISIVNLGGPQNYKLLKEGEEVSLKGEIWKTETENHINVKEIISDK